MQAVTPYSVSQTAQTPAGQDINARISGAMDALKARAPQGGPFGGLMGKGGASTPSAATPDLSKVPTATGGFFQPMETPARSSLLQTMMQRSRAGRGLGA
jgi:hypothetical protein